MLVFEKLNVAESSKSSRSTGIGFGSTRAPDLILKPV